MYVAARVTIRRARRDRRASTTPALDHFCALADVCAVAFEVLRGGGGPESFQPRRERPPARAVC